MPRHRLHGRPGTRAQRQETEPGRGAQSDATQTALAVGPEYSRVMRNLLLTPWFAVSVGIVVAASLTLATPHAALTFPPSAGGPCAHFGCPPRDPNLPGQPRPATKRAVKLRISDKRYIRAQPSLIKVDFEVLPRNHGQFTAVIVLTSDKVLGKWSLRFSLPGGRIKSVMWANWAPDGSGGVVVDGAPLPWPRSGADQARIVILGTGTPQWPAGCVIDDARCTFRALRGAPGRPPASG